MAEILDLKGLFITSGLAEDVSEEGGKEYRGFCTIRAEAEDGTVMIGQLDPDEVRMTAFGWLEAAEASIQDSIVMMMLTEDVELPPEVAAKFITAMRKRRDARHGGDDEEPGPSLSEDPGMGPS